MTKKPTLSTVAKEAGVSIPTVSQVMRGTGRISNQTRERVLEAAKRLNYVLDRRAASMRSGENREVGFVINQLANPFNAEVVSGVVDFLETEDYVVSIFDTRDELERQHRHIESVIRHRRGALLWVPALGTSPDTFRLLEANKLPTVTFLRDACSDTDHVGIRNAEATLTGTRYLADLGHRHIAYLGGTDMTVVRSERIQGYREAMSERGLGSGVVWTSADDKLAGIHSMHELHRAYPEMTAIVCNGDMVALGACVAISRLGLQPGQDISVIGFDDIRDAEAGMPPLTTMAVYPKKLGHMLASTVLDRIRSPDSPVQTIEVSAELIIRETTGKAPIRDQPTRTQCP